MKPLKVILLGAAISFASQAHSQAELTGLLATVPLGSLSLSPTGGGLPLTLQTVDVVLPLVDGLTASGIPLPTASLLGGLTPVVLDLTNTAVIPLLGGVVAGGII